MSPATLRQILKLSDCLAQNEPGPIIEVIERLIHDANRHAYLAMEGADILVLHRGNGQILRRIPRADSGCYDLVPEFDTIEWLVYYIGEPDATVKYEALRAELAHAIGEPSDHDVAAVEGRGPTDEEIVDRLLSLRRLRERVCASMNLQLGDDGPSDDELITRLQQAIRPEWDVPRALSAVTPDVLAQLYVQLMLDNDGQDLRVPTLEALVANCGEKTAGDLIGAALIRVVR